MMQYRGRYTVGVIPYHDFFICFCLALDLISLNLDEEKEKAQKEDSFFSQSSSAI